MQIFVSFLVEKPRGLFPLMKSNLANMRQRGLKGL